MHVYLDGKLSHQHRIGDFSTDEFVHDRGAQSFEVFDSAGRVHSFLRCDEGTFCQASGIVLRLFARDPDAEKEHVLLITYGCGEFCAERVADPRAIKLVSQKMASEWQAFTPQHFARFLLATVNEHDPEELLDSDSSYCPCKAVKENLDRTAACPVQLSLHCRSAARLAETWGQ